MISIEPELDVTKQKMTGNKKTRFKPACPLENITSPNFFVGSN